MKSSRTALFLLLACLTSAGCSAHHGQTSAAPTAPSILTGYSAHPGEAQGWVETRLFFGLGPADHPEQGITEERWRAFLDKEVTARFPDGLSVLEVYGQWQGKNQTSPERLHSKMLLIEHPDTLENRARIDAIRAAWKQLTGDQSVLRVTIPAEVSF